MFKKRFSQNREAIRTHITLVSIYDFIRTTPSNKHHHSGTAPLPYKIIASILQYHRKLTLKIIAIKAYAHNLVSGGDLTIVNISPQPLKIPTRKKTYNHIFNITKCVSQIREARHNHIFFYW